MFWASVKWKHGLTMQIWGFFFHLLKVTVLLSSQNEQKGVENQKVMHLNSGDSILVYYVPVNLCWYQVGLHTARMCYKNVITTLVFSITDPDQIIKENLPRQQNKNNCLMMENCFSVYPYHNGTHCGLCVFCT